MSYNSYSRSRYKGLGAEYDLLAERKAVEKDDRPLHHTQILFGGR